MLSREREAVRTAMRSPALWVGGFLFLVVRVGAVGVAALSTSLVVLPDGAWGLLSVMLGSALAVLGTPLALAGQYAALRAADAGDPATLEEFAAGIPANYRPLLSATVRMRLAALPLAAAVFGVLLAVDAGATYWQYATGPATVGRFPAELLFAGALALAAGAVARAPLVFYDLPVLYGDADPSEGWRAGLRVARRRPKFLLRYLAGRALCWSPAVLLPAGVGGVAWLATGSDALPTGAFVVAVALVALGPVLAAALVAAYHVRTFERADVEATAAATTDADSVGLPTARVAVALVVLLAVVAGGSAVRVADVQPAPETASVDRSMTAEAIVEQARSVAARHTHRARMTVDRTNATTGERTRVSVWTFGHDRAERRVRMSVEMHDEGSTITSGHYASESTFATKSGPVVPRSQGLGLFQYSAGKWHAMPFGGYATLGGGQDAQGDYVPAATNWTVREWRADTVVVGMTNSADEGKRNRSIRLVVDRDTGLPQRTVEAYTLVIAHHDRPDERYRVVKTTEFTYEGVSVDRPSALGPRSPLEWLWDLVSY